MAFRQAARATERFSVSWPSDVTAASVSEADAKDIGGFLLRVGHPLRPECEAGTLAGATFYVTRLFDYHRQDKNYPFALDSSTVVRRPSNGIVVGMCLIGGGGADGHEFGVYDIQVDPDLQNRGIGTRMIRRALTVLAEHGVSELNLWRNDENPARRLYERLGFQLTGAVE